MRNMKLACLTLWQPNYQSLADLILPNRKEYCDRHGYKSCFKLFDFQDGSLKDVQRKLGFAKLRMILETFEDQPDLDGLWFADLDGMVTNMQTKLERIFDQHPTKDLLLSTDARGMNPGSVLVRNTTWAKWTLEIALRMAVDQRVPYEGEALGLALNFWTFEQPGTHMEATCWQDEEGPILVPQRTMNSYQYNLYEDIKPFDILGQPANWEVGDFFIHWPGRNLEQRIQHFKDYEKRIIR